MWNKPHLLNAIADVLMLAASAALLVMGVVWLVRVPSLPVQQVAFLGELPHTRRAEIEQVLPAALKANFFSLNLESVRGALEKLPWVRKVEVRRVWPARLEVKVEEHKAVARWGDGRGELVNSFGEVFSATPRPDEMLVLPQLFGPPGTAPEVLKRYGEFITTFAEVQAKPLLVNLSARLAWQVKLDNGVLVDIGREQPKSPVHQRLQRFIEMYPETIGKRSIKPEVVDLRYPNGFAMRVAGEGKGK